ncbi:hypothetical protein L6164_019721 [Bauhinia variegata]|uniref:Uncharacterized protein n=1 Tax=Bauhinia variegata TaxID=167791 RepID=A0ACB9MU39_BAUVA|nr:hypothetical protein L6164_019721 [Bauhinia variegata]
MIKQNFLQNKPQSNNVTVLAIQVPSKTTRNCGASESLAGGISHRHGSSSSETGQCPASETLSAEAATDPNSNTDVLAGRETIRPRYLNWFCCSSRVLRDFAPGWDFLPFHQETKPMAVSVGTLLIANLGI